MPGKVRFYRGAQGASLPATKQDGAIFILERSGSTDGSYTLGDMYVDMDNGKRLHIIPDSEFVVYNSSMVQTESTLGQVYLFQESDKKGIAVGDGSAYIGDLPVYNSSVRSAIQSKVNAYLGTEYSNLTRAQKQADGLNLPSQSEELGETLVLSREL